MFGRSTVRGRVRSGTLLRLMSWRAAEGVVQEVYEIRDWYSAGSTLSSRTDAPDPDRWEFVGSLAPPKIRNRYRYKAVRSYLPPKSQNPIRYVNV